MYIHTDIQMSIRLVMDESKVFLFDLQKVCKHVQTVCSGLLLKLPPIVRDSCRQKTKIPHLLSPASIVQALDGVRRMLRMAVTKSWKVHTWKITPQRKHLIPEVKWLSLESDSTYQWLRTYNHSYSSLRKWDDHPRNELSNLGCNWAKWPTANGCNFGYHLWTCADSNTPTEIQFDLPETLKSPGEYKYSIPIVF